MTASAMVNLVELTADSRVIISGGFVLLPDGRHLTDGAVSIHGSKIVGIGPVGSQNDPGARVLDARNKWVLPGLIDAGAHFGGQLSGLLGQTVSREIRQNCLLLQSAQSLEAVLLAGLTAVRVRAGPRADGIYALRQAVREGIVRGPIVITSPALVGNKVFGGSLAHWHTMRNARRYLGQGAMVLTLHTDYREAPFSAMTIRLLIEEAHSRGARVAIRAVTRREASDAIRGGVDIVEGVPPGIGRRLIEEMASSGTFLMPALSRNRTRRQEKEQVVTLARECGVRVLAGSGANLDHCGLVRELQALRDTGFSVWDVMRAATSDAASALGLRKALGAIEVGMRAALVTVESNGSSSPPFAPHPHSIADVIQPPQHD